LYASDERPNDHLGQSVAINKTGTVVVAGGPMDDYGDGAGAKVDAGSARVWKSTSYWSPTAWYPHYTSLVNNPVNAGAWVGWSVDISDDGKTIAVGAPKDEPGITTDAGRVLIFTEPGGNGWSSGGLALPSHLSKRSNPVTNDQLGKSVAISGDGSTVVAGVPYDTVSVTQQGSAAVFVKPGGLGWADGLTNVESAILREGASTAGYGDGFGLSVAISSNGAAVVVGAPYAEDASGSGANHDEGLAFIFDRGASWSGERSPTQMIYSQVEQSQAAYVQSVTIVADGNEVTVGSVSAVAPVQGVQTYRR
jgi:hypothetical protein